MLVFTSYLCFLTCGISILFSVYLISRFKQFINTYYLIGIIFCIFWIEFYMYALNSKLILTLPFLFRTALPFRGLVLPFLWWYVWAMLHPNQKIKSIQLLHFIIPVIIIIFLTPDFLQTKAYKLNLLNQFYLHNNALMNKPTGILPAGFIQPFLLVYGLMYSFYTLFYIYQFSKKKGKVFLDKNKIVLRWLKLVAATISFFILLQTLQYLSLFYSGNFSVIAQIGQSTSLIIMKAYFLLNPLVIENMDGCIDNQLSVDISSPQTNQLIPSPNNNYLNDSHYIKLHHYFINNKAYLNPELTISQSSIDLGINKNKLSNLIQLFYSINFAELINRLRINHFIQLVDNNKNLTLESLIYQSGFLHRSTFYAAFKKYIGINPTTYLKEHKKQI